MRRWLALLAGPLLWAAHFLIIYAIASIAELRGEADAPLSRSLIVASGALAAALAGWLLLRALRSRDGDEFDMFVRTISALGAVLALIAIVWQTLPALAL